MKKWVGVEWWEGTSAKVPTTILDGTDNCEHLSAWKNWRGREGKCFTNSQTGERLTKKLKKTLLIDPELKFQFSLLKLSSCCQYFFYTSSCFIIITKLGTKCKNNHKLTTICSYFHISTLKQNVPQGHIVLFKLIGRKDIKSPFRLMDFGEIHPADLLAISTYGLTLDSKDLSHFYRTAAFIIKIRSWCRRWHW